MGRNTLTLGYAIVAAETLLAPVTPSNTARSGGTIYPIIRNIPELYDSKPDDPSARLIGSYIMWVAVASVAVTSSMFLTSFAPNPLAVAFVRQTDEHRDHLARLVRRLRAGRHSAASRRSSPHLLVLSARHQTQRESLPMGRARACSPGENEPARDDRGGSREHRALLLDLRRPQRERDDGLARRGRDDDPDQGLQLGRRAQISLGVEHADLARDAGRARGRAQPRRLRLLVRGLPSPVSWSACPRSRR